MRAKHEQLLAPTRELVIPVHYKKLLEILKCLDNSLNFLKKCRKQNSCTFDELKKSIEKTNGRQFECATFKQILFIYPEAYGYKWENNQTTLLIDFPENEENFLSLTKLEDRFNHLKKLLLERTKTYHDTFLSEEFKEQDASQFSNVFETKMWHHKFDPHSVPAVPMAELIQKTQTKQHQRSESVKDFLNRSKLLPDSGP